LALSLQLSRQCAFRPSIPAGGHSTEVPTDKVGFSDASIRLVLPQGTRVAEVKLLTPDKDASTEFDWSAADGAVVIKPRDLVRYSVFSVVLK
jgi:hypothetical protein